MSFPYHSYDRLPDPGSLAKRTKMSKYFGNHMLYEGNYKGWGQRLTAEMKARHSNCMPLFAAKRKLRSDLTLAVECASFMRGRVAPHILDRVPETAREDPVRLKALLAGVAKPFPLMELPVELRLWIVELSFRSLYRDREYTICAYSTSNPQAPYEFEGRLDGDTCAAVVGNGRMPSVLHSNHQLREEMLPLFYAGTEVHISANNTGRERIQVTMPLYINLLKERLGTEVFRYLRKACVHSRPKRAPSSRL